MTFLSLSYIVKNMVLVFAFQMA